MIELNRLTKSFGSKYALRGVDLRVMPGESLVISGYRRRKRILWGEYAVGFDALRAAARFPSGIGGP